jgi:hypothetical protein
MSISTSAFGLAAHEHRRSSRKAIPNHVFGGAAVACLVLGCAWTLHANVFGASVYPQLSSANFDSPVIRRPPFAVRSAPSAADSIAAALPEPAPLISAPASLPSRPLLSFDDRFAAAAPQSVEPSAPVETLTQRGRRRAPPRRGPRKIQVPPSAIWHSAPRRR